MLIKLCFNSTVCVCVKLFLFAHVVLGLLVVKQVTSRLDYNKVLYVGLPLESLETSAGPKCSSQIAKWG